MENCLKDDKWLLEPITAQMNNSGGEEFKNPFRMTTISDFNYDGIVPITCRSVYSV